MSTSINNKSTIAKGAPEWNMPVGLQHYRSLVASGDYELNRLMIAPLADMPQGEREAALMTRAQVQLLLRLSHKNLLR